METPVNAPLKEKFRLEIAKLREMSFKEKLEHIWEYYKFFIFGLVIILVISGSLINSLLINPQPQTALHISWNSGFIMHEQLTGLSDVLTARLIDEAKNETIVVSLSLTSADDPSIEMANQQRLIAMLAAGELDVFIVDEALLEEYSSFGFIQPLENLLEDIRLIDPVVYEEIKDKVAYAKIEPEEGVFEERLMGVNITGCPLLTELGLLEFLESDLFFSLSATSQRQEKAAGAIIAFFE